MNWTGLVNWLVSGAVAFVVGFVSVPYILDNTSLRHQLIAGVTMGFIGMVNQLRQNPFTLNP